MNVDDYDFCKDNLIVYYDQVVNEFCISLITHVDDNCLRMKDVFSSITNENGYNGYVLYFHQFKNNAYEFLEQIIPDKLNDDYIEELKLKYCEYLI